MNRKLILCCLIAGFSFTGCKKLHSFFHKDTEKTATNTAVETITAAPGVPTTPKAPSVAEAPTPQPVKAINKAAVAICLCYHNIEDGKSNALTISVAEFEKEMQALKDNGFTVIPMQDFLAWRRGEKDIPAKSALITIDDGWISAYTTAWPILKKYNYPFTLFIYINYVNSGGKSMSWDQLAELRDAGADIESHTYSHADLKKPGALVDKHNAELIRKDIATLGEDGWLRKEIVDSKHVLEKQLGIKVNTFAYPFGLYNDKARAMVKEAGYEAAFTVYGQQLRMGTPPYDLLGRYAVDTKHPQTFTDAIKMIGGGVSGTPAPDADYAQLASASMVTQPMDGETIGNATPTIKANLATMGPIDPGSVKMRISGIGPVPAKYDETSKTVSYTVTKKLTETNYTVILTANSGGKKVETQWSFNFDPTGKNVGPAPVKLPPRQ